MERETFRRMTETQGEHWWFAGRRAVLGSVIRRLKLAPDAAILEAGCGPGGNLAMLSRFGNVSAFEPDDMAAADARALSGLAVEKGFLPDDIPFGGPFDLVCAFDVIEHVEADAASLAALFRLTKRGGHAIFTVPAFMFLWSAHDVANQHWRRYTRPAFRRLLEQAGYTVEFISYYNTILFPAVAGVRFLKKALKIKDAPDEAMPGPGLNRFLRCVFGSERHILRFMAMPFGTSIIAVCRRNGMDS